MADTPVDIDSHAPAENSADVYCDTSRFVARPRIDALAVSPDGQRAVIQVTTLDDEGTGYHHALWQIDPSDPGVPARRLTRSARGETSAVFTAAGDLLFLSRRPDPAANGSGAKADESADAPQVWLLPASGGEPVALTGLAGGVMSVATAAQSAAALVVAGVLPSATSLEDDAALRAGRNESKVRAILHESYPVRYWDHDLGPDSAHLVSLPLPVDAGDVAELPVLADLTPDVQRGEFGATPVLSPDGTWAVAVRAVAETRGSRDQLVRISLPNGEITVLADDPGADLSDPALSADGSTLAWQRVVRDTPAGPGAREVWVGRADGSGARQVAVGWDRWVNEMVVTPNGDRLVVTADEDGAKPIFTVDLAAAGSAVQRLTSDEGAYTHIALDPVTGDVLALRSTLREAHRPVRVSAADGAVTTLAAPITPAVLPGRSEVLRIPVADGRSVRAVLHLPAEADASHPAPLLLWVHGGPLHSWNEWSWRWCPGVMLAHGYAVLQPDPALSTGYGTEHIEAGWNAWGKTPFTDLMAATDAACARADIDETRTAAMGGSFGGYMAAWIAGHTDRFRAIVDHAGLWAMDQFAGTTDGSQWWDAMFTPEGLAACSPHQAVEAISTPMLVIHGDHDYRVPIGEALRLWNDLARHHAAEDGSMPHRFLYFPNENHWILSPNHAAVWYETILAFLDQHVNGEDWKRPAYLG